MADDTTTIEITDEQRAALDDRKRHDSEAMKDVVGRLLDGETGDDTGNSPAVDTDELADHLVDELGAAAGGPQVDDSDIARAVVAQFDYTELAARVADELEGRMR